MSQLRTTTIFRPASVANDPSLRVLSVACGLTEISALPSTGWPRPTVTTAGRRLITRSLRAVDRQATALRKHRGAQRTAV